jgi:sucrose-6-phosphate hydrolase SacC (GH32 family)
LQSRGINFTDQKILNLIDGKLNQISQNPKKELIKITMKNSRAPKTNINEESKIKLAENQKKKFEKQMNWKQEDFISLVKDNDSFKKINLVYQACKEFKAIHNNAPSYL